MSAKDHRLQFLDSITVMSKNRQPERPLIYSRISTEEIELLPPPEISSHITLDFHRCVTVEGISIVRKYESSKEHLVTVRLTEVANIDVSKRLGSLFKSLSLY